MTDIAVRLLGVTKRYGDFVAVDSIDLDVRDGEFFSLLGPSGCGKTTTLRMIGGFEEPTSGRVELAGRDVTWLPPYQRDVNTVFQNYALFPHLSIYENVAFGLRRERVAESEIRRRVGELLELVQLVGYEKRRPSQISGGQAQRVALARALVNEPEVLLLDEPLGALDLKLRKQMQLELKRIQGEVGITFVYVTHDQEEAMTMSDRIAVMNHGRYEQLGDPESLYERPATRFVAGFLGVSNLLPVTRESSDGDHVAFRSSVGTLRAPRAALEAATSAGALSDGARDGAIALGIRPEKIRLLDRGADAQGSPNRLDAVIRSAAYLGVSTQYVVELADGHAVTVYEQNVERATKAELWAPGEEVTLVWSPDHSFIVSAGSPERSASTDDASLDEAP